MNKISWGGLLYVVGSLGVAGTVQAQMINTSGRVALPDGTIPDGAKITVQVDINRNGKLEKFETINGTVKSDGRYSLDYGLDPASLGLSDLAEINELQKIVTKYQQGGFPALIEDGPLAVVLTIEREGYSTIVKRFNTMGEAPKLDLMLEPLAAVSCSGESCASSSGGVVLSGFSENMGAARAFAETYAPGPDKSRFPGTFSDSEDNLLVSSGFTEISLFDKDGKQVHEMSEPVDVRYQIDRSAWPTLPDLQADSGRIELPMYSFETKTAQWVREADGELQDKDGKPVKEASLAAIHDGTLEGDVFAAFSTQHFSYFNCDAPISIRACVKGRLVDASGKAIVGVMVSVEGVSYQGDMGPVFTGADGAFASDLIKTENADEDIDFNGKRGEKFTARVRASSSAGVFIGATFDSPTSERSIGSFGAMGCQPQACDCVDLGDVKASFEPPRLCKLTVHGVFSGENAFGGEDGPLAKGAVVEGASISARMAGAMDMPVTATAQLCAKDDCHAEIDADGTATFSVPMIGDKADLTVQGNLDVTDADGKHHTYSGSVNIAGCALGEASVKGMVEVAFVHSTGDAFGAYLEQLFGAFDGGGAGGGSSYFDGLGSGDQSKDGKDPLKCGCRVAGAGGSSALAGSSLLAVISALVLRRRRKH